MVSKSTVLVVVLAVVCAFGFVYREQVIEGAKNLLPQLQTYATTTIEKAKKDPLPYIAPTVAIGSVVVGGCAWLYKRAKEKTQREAQQQILQNQIYAQNQIQGYQQANQQLTQQSSQVQQQLQTSQQQLAQSQNTITDLHNDLRNIQNQLDQVTAERNIISKKYENLLDKLKLKDPPIA